MAVLVLALIILVALPALSVWAQTNPFGAPRPAVPLADNGLVTWLLAKQGEFYRQLSALVRAAKVDGHAAWTLLGVSFVYGVFHAAGPGHGKAVISSYLVANEETWRRGIVLSLASALLQALVAVLIVAIAAAALKATARTMESAVRWIEIVSYALIAAMGARLTFVKGGAFVKAIRRARAADRAHDDHGHGSGAHHDHAPPAAVAANHGHDHAHHHEHGHEHDHRDHHDHHEHDAHCGHSHGPEPAELAGPGGWRRGLTAIIAVGLRPCSGAILVLVFALAQGLFWAGIASTFAMGLGTAITVAAIATLSVGAKGLANRLANHRSGAGTLVLRGIETGAAVLVLAFGVALLFGYMVAERIVGV